MQATIPISCRIVGKLILFLLVVVPLWSGSAAATDEFERSPVNYQTTPPHDRVAKLAAAVRAGDVHLKWDQRYGFLPAVLQELDVPVSSQALVFSKTSLQVPLISPRYPRALYFNDDVYVGYCHRGGVLEIAATDPQLGAVFYTLSQTKPNEPDEPKVSVNLVRDNGQCLSCHASHRTQDVPGYLIRSVFTDSAGQPFYGRGTMETDVTSEFNERWGGWYVTGRHGRMRHMGNIVLAGRDAELDWEAGANRMVLPEQVVREHYLTETSDIVALMVLGHQTQMHNALAHANQETRRALHQSEEMNRLLQRPEDFISESAARRIEAAADRVVEHLLFCDEVPLVDPITESSPYRIEFEARGMKDSTGRTLRDFDLETRLFRFPCSYLVYSDAYFGLPETVRDRVKQKLAAVLRMETTSDRFTHLTDSDRRNVLEILTQTHPDF